MIEVEKKSDIAINRDTEVAGEGFLSSSVYLTLIDNSIEQSSVNF